MKSRKTAADLINDSHDMQMRRLQVQLASKEGALEAQRVELEHRRLQLESMLALQTSRPVSIARPRTKLDGTQRDATAVLMCSDWHIEETVDPKTVNGLNEYNPTIARARIARMAEAFCWLVRDKRFSIRDAILWLGGDLITGYIHEELMESNFMSPVQAVLWVQDEIEKMIRTILRDTDLERIVIPCNYGNHGRTGLKTRIQTGAANSFEWMLYHNLANRFADEKRVQFNIADGEHLYVNIHDKVARFQHGDAVRYHGGVGGLTIPLRKAIAQWQTVRRADMDHFGHWHTYTDVPGFAVNGSMIGFNAFALHIKAAFEPPAQAFYLWDRKRGPCQKTAVWF